MTNPDFFSSLVGMYTAHIPNADGWIGQKGHKEHKLIIGLKILYDFWYRSLFHRPASK
jgi:hypothetical protein